MHPGGRHCAPARARAEAGALRQRPAPSPARRVLLVEGQEDLRVVPWLVESTGIDWGPRDSPLVTIAAYDGVENLLAAGEIEARMKASGLQALGVMVDADESAPARWSQIRTRIQASYPAAPVDLPPDGVVLRSDTQPAFGAWIMPDNTHRGMLETFLLHLRPSDNPPVLALSSRLIEEARSLGAPFSEAHRDKARIHSWLAWQDPPGRPLHNAVMERMLRARTPTLDRFIAWFCRLYSVAPPASPVASQT